MNPIDAVTKAFEDVKDDDAIELTTEPVVKQEEKTDKDPVEATESTEESTSEEKAPVVEPETAKEPEEESIEPPIQAKREFVTKAWKDTPVEAQKEIVRLAEENERNFKRAAEAEYNSKQRREVLKPVMGYVAQIAEQAKITEDEVIRNSLDLVQKLNDSPTQTARQIIAGGIIQFDDPISVVNEIIKKYNLDIKHDYQSAQMPPEYHQNRAQALYNARQARYVPDTQDSAQGVDTETANIDRKSVV